MNSKNFNDAIGLDFIGMIDNRYVIDLEIAPHHHNIQGIVHGGVLCTLLDTAMARAFFHTFSDEAQGEEKKAGTLEMKVNFLRPSSAGKLRAYGKLINTTRRTAYVEGQVENQDGKLLAKASATLMRFENQSE